MKSKPILCAQRLRHVPHQFSWIDQRLIRDGHIRGRSTSALALYLFLCTVADAQGISYYSDSRVGELLGLDAPGLRTARRELIHAGLVAFAQPFYQVLSLDPHKMEPLPQIATSPVPTPTPTPASALDDRQNRSGQVQSIGQILRSMTEAQP